MKLKQINIINFGQLSNVTFDLPSDQLNVFYGANEAGKSTTVAFIKQILFGFHLKNKKAAFFEDYVPLSKNFPMGGELLFVDNSGDKFLLHRVWSKGDESKKGTLTVKLNGQLIPEEVFFDKIKNINGSFYADSFIFNQDMLGQVSGLSQQELLEQIYYLGMAQSNKLLTYRDQFNKQADNLFKRTGRKPEVNQLLARVDEQQAELNHSLDEFDQYRKLSADKANEQKYIDELIKNRETIQVELAKNNKLQTKLVNYKKWLQLKDNIKDIDFNLEDYQKAQNINAQIINLQKQEKETEEKLAKINLNELSLDQKQSIVNQKAQILQNHSDLVQKAEELKQLQLEQTELEKVNSSIPVIAHFTDAQIAKLKADYSSLKQIIAKPVTTDNHIGTYLGVILIILGIILLKVTPLSILIVIAGVISIGYGINLNNKSKQKIQNYNNQIKQYQQKTAEYQENYQLNINDDINIILQQAKQYRLKLYAIQNKFEQLKQLKANEQNYISKVENIINKPINNYDSLINIIDNLTLEIDQSKSEQANYNYLQDQLRQLVMELKQTQLQLKTILVTNKVEDLKQYEVKYQNSLNQIKLKMQLAALKENIGSDFAKMQEYNADPDQIIDYSKKLKEKLEKLNTDITKRTKIEAEYELELKQLADSDIIFDNQQNFKKLQAMLVNSVSEYLGDAFAADVISRTLDLASNERFPKMLVAANGFFKLLTGNKYSGLKLDRKLYAIKNDGKKVEVKYLSRGTSEQLYFALKLAFAQQIQDKINLPILIDDSFVNFDDQRVNYIEELLEKISKENQIIIFTAQKALVSNLTANPVTFENEE